MYTDGCIKNLEATLVEIDRMTQSTKNVEEKGKLLLFKLDIQNSINQLKQYLNIGEDANEKGQEKRYSVVKETT
jgi:hypothetical protein